MSTISPGVKKLAFFCLIGALILSGANLFMNNNRRQTEADQLVRINSFCDALVKEIDFKIQVSNELINTRAVNEWFMSDGRALSVEVENEMDTNIFSIGVATDWFLANMDSLDMYFNGKKADTLDPEDPDDQWFFDSVNSSEDQKLTIDTNMQLNMIWLWIEKKCFSSDGTLRGILGIGADISAALSQFIEKEAGDDIIILTDKNGHIIKVSDPRDFVSWDVYKSLKISDKLRATIEDNFFSAEPLFFNHHFNKTDYKLTCRFFEYQGIELVVYILKKKDFLSA